MQSGAPRSAALILSMKRAAPIAPTSRGGPAGPPLSPRLPAPVASHRMQGITTRSITLRDERESLNQQALKSGRLLSESEVVAEALDEFQVPSPADAEN